MPRNPKGRPENPNASFPTRLEFQQTLPYLLTYVLNPRYLSPSPSSPTIPFSTFLLLPSPLARTYPPAKAKKKKINIQRAINQSPTSSIPSLTRSLHLKERKNSVHSSFIHELRAEANIYGTGWSGVGCTFSHVYFPTEIVGSLGAVLRVAANTIDTARSI